MASLENVLSSREIRSSFACWRRDSIRLLFLLFCIIAALSHTNVSVSIHPPRAPHLHSFLSTRTHLLSPFLETASVVKTVWRKVKELRILLLCLLFFITKQLDLSSLDFSPLLRSALTGGGSAKRDTENGVGTEGVALGTKLRKKKNRKKKHRDNTCDPHCI